jgi:hypothetical protein
LPLSEHWKEIDFILKTLSSVPDSNLIISLHPKCVIADYESITRKYSARIARDFPIEQLVPFCDIFISAYSSTVIFAIGCHKPAVVIDFYDMNYDFFDDCRGVTIVKEKSQFFRTVNRILESETVYQEMVNLQKTIAPDWIMLDGQCCKRIEGLIEEMVN